MTALQSHESHALNYHAILKQTQRQRVSDGKMISILSGCESATRLLVLIWPQLGDFDSLEYACLVATTGVQATSTGGSKDPSRWHRRSLVGTEILRLYSISYGLAVCRSRGGTALLTQTLSRSVTQDTRAFVPSKCLAQLDADVCGNWQSRDPG